MHDDPATYQARLCRQITDGIGTLAWDHLSALSEALATVVWLRQNWEPATTNSAAATWTRIAATATDWRIRRVATDAANHMAAWAATFTEEPAA